MNGLLNKALRKVFSICWRCGSRFYIFLRRLVKTLPAPQQGSTAGKKAVYLTFDDGPLPQTAALLDTLKRYGAHATFFVSGGSAPDLIGRMAREGHCVGNHTFSHKYREIYAGEDAFFKDAAEMDAVICSQTGAPSRLASRAVREPAANHREITVTVDASAIMNRTIRISQRIASQFILLPPFLFLGVYL